jgi:hypothetical protein
MSDWNVDDLVGFGDEGMSPVSGPRRRRHGQSWRRWVSALCDVWMMTSKAKRREQTAISQGQPAATSETWGKNLEGK